MSNSVKIHKIRQGDPHYPAQLCKRMGQHAPASIAVAGDANILGRPSIGLICSIQCPGSIIIKTFDMVRALRDAGVTMIGGFHSPMEKDCLEILLRGSQPLILALAKGFSGLRLGQEAMQALGEGRLLVLTKFPDDLSQVTLAHAVERNRLVAALADALFVPYAVSGGKTNTLVCESLQQGQKVYTVDDENNKELIALGVKPCRSGSLDETLSPFS